MQRALRWKSALWSPRWTWETNPGGCRAIRLTFVLKPGERDTGARRFVCRWCQTSAGISEGYGDREPIKAQKTPLTVSGGGRARRVPAEVPLVRAPAGSNAGPGRWRGTGPTPRHLDCCRFGWRAVGDSSVSRQVRTKDAAVHVNPTCSRKGSWCHNAWPVPEPNMFFNAMLRVRVLQGRCYDVTVWFASEGLRLIWSLRFFLDIYCLIFAVQLLSRWLKDLLSNKHASLCLTTPTLQRLLPVHRLQFRSLRQMAV